MSRFRPTLAVAGACALALAGAAMAADASKDATLAAPAVAAAPGKPAPAAAALGSSELAPRRYTLVNSGSLTSPDGAQVRGVATCPGRTVPLGGGVFIRSTSTRANVNSSFPQGRSWIGDVNNASGAETTFEIRVVCARRPRLYALAQSESSVPNPPGTQRGAAATCPAGMSPLGGGVLSNSTLLSVNMNSSLPVGASWRVDQNNASAANAGFTVIAVCGKLRGYTVVTGPATATPASRQTGAIATCPAPTVPIGGGVFSSSGSVDVNINATSPRANGWDSYVNNASAFAASMTPIVVCAGTA